MYRQFEVWMCSSIYVYGKPPKGIADSEAEPFFDLSSEMCPHKMLNTHTITVSNLTFAIVSTTEYVWSPHLLLPPRLHLPMVKDRQIVLG